MAKQIFQPIPWLTGEPITTGFYLVTVDSTANLLPRIVLAAYYDRDSKTWQGYDLTPLPASTRVLAWWPMWQVAVYTGPVASSAKPEEGGPERG